MTHLDVQAVVTKTGTFDGASIDISGITGDWTLVFEVYAANASNSCRFTFEDSVDAFTTPLAGPGTSVLGQIGNGSNIPKYPDVKRYTWTKRDYPDLRFGTTSAVLRLSLTAISGGSSQSVTYKAWIEY